ncbi:MAG: putative transcriptional regulator, AsnC family [Frankiales bacterium]|nr:putative transcriptional regulator, AsnC family [Frankiales bacterium]
MSKRRPDPVDERILRLLVRNARASWREVGDEVGLSANAVAQRVKRLEQDGWVRGYTAQLDPALDGAATSAVVLLTTTTHVPNAEIEQLMAAMPQVVEVLDLAGPVDYHVRVRVSGPPELYDVVNALRALPGVTGIETRPVLREVLSR